MDSFGVTKGPALSDGALMLSYFFLVLILSVSVTVVAGRRLASSFST